MKVQNGIKDIIIHSIIYALQNQRELIFSTFPKDEEVLTFLLKRLQEKGEIDFDAMIADHINECKKTGQDVNVIVEFFIAFVKNYPQSIDFLLKHKDEFCTGVYDTLTLFKELSSK